MIGVKHSWDMIRIKRNTIEDIVPLILKNEDYIATLFDFKKRHPIKKTGDYSITTELLKIYIHLGAWCISMQIILEKKKKIDHYMFQLSPI